MSNKNVTIQSLRLQHFKGVKELCVDFGNKTTISGANATGKTTVFDAFTWCLFGKDSADRTDSGRGGFSVKTVDKAGKPIEQLEHEVTATMAADGVVKTFTRRLVENWVKPRGKAYTELKGNDTHYFINGVEVKASQYQQEVAGLIEERLFKMITNPAYFPGLDWKVQRDILLRIAGGVTLDEVAAGRADFQQILQQLSGRDLDAFRQEIAYKKKTVKAELEKCPIEVNAVEAVTPAAPDYAALAEEEAGLKASLQDIEAAKESIAEANRQAYELQRKSYEQIADLQAKAQRLAIDANAEVERRRAEYRAQRSLTSQEYQAAVRERSSHARNSEFELSNLQEKIDRMQKDEVRQQERIEKARADWKARAAETYKRVEGEITCPLYGVICKDEAVKAKAAEAQDRAAAAFIEKQNADLKFINEAGRAMAAELKTLQEMAADLQNQLKERTEATQAEAVALQQKEADALKAFQQYDVLPNIPDTDPNSLPEYAKLQDEIRALQQNAANVAAEAQQQTPETLKLEEARIREALKEIDAKRSVQATIDRNAAAIAKIRDREMELAQQLADLENIEFAAEELNKARVSEVERRVNSKFNFVRFRMFEPQLNGGKVPTCIASVDGVKYADLNNAMKINAGLDIINTLCAFHGVTAPVFIDNAESVNTLIPIESQLIRLVVTEDKKLRITAEA